MNLELLTAFNDKAKARSVADAIDGTLLCDERSETGHLPFSALVIGTTDDLQSLVDAADVGAYLVCRRVIKPRSGSVAGEAVGIFPLVAHPQKGHTLADQHWRDKHAPLALEVHQAMSHYVQLSILHQFHGPDWDGIALCGFDSVDDLRHKFFATDEGKQAIADDVARFADGKKSPRRVIATTCTYADSWWRMQ